MEKFHKYVATESGIKKIKKDGAVESFKIKTKFESADYHSVFTSFNDRIIKGGPVGKTEPMTTLESYNMKKSKAHAIESRKVNKDLKKAASEAVNAAKKSVKEADDQPKEEKPVEVATTDDKGVADVCPDLQKVLSSAVVVAVAGIPEFQEIDSEPITKEKFIEKGLEALGSAKNMRKLLASVYDTLKITPDCSMKDCIVNTLECDNAVLEKDKKEVK